MIVTEQLHTYVPLNNIYQLSATITTQLHRVVHSIVSVPLLDIEFHKFNWRIIETTIQLTQSDLYRVRGGAGECLSEVWRIVE
ncbi:hypothetical protein GBAR_LOCUS31620 [Geodia barretti]|uniref:Uncharacterized protein n=1 Tax=Geodia barretti TaxID=519541 RepID=A0AA35U3M8_GEOBA|nr:hypothetical protein GBAR_LOCUS31620 [Geodia barretti]